MPINNTNGSVCFDGPAAVNVFRCLTIASALELYAKTGMKVNRAYTPTAMLRCAAEITGKRFKRGQYREAAAALRLVASVPVD